MSDPASVAIRFVVYLALSLAFGTSAMAVLGRRGLSRRMMAGLVAVALGASASSLVMTGAAMGGVPAIPVDWTLMTVVLTETPMGSAFVVRFAALGAAMAALALSRGRALAVASCTAIALGSLAWAGHGAMHEGTARVAHLASTTVHLLAAAMWIGGIATLLVGLSRPDAVAAMRNFSRVGSAVVMVLAITGLANLIFIVGANGIPALPAAAYGRLLLLKLAGFGAMLGLAALHRWYLVPRLAHARRGGRTALRVSLAMEASFALLVLGLVAWLGTMAPGG